MAYDEELADRIRAVLAPEPGLSEKKMFGGLGFMLDGHMAAAAGSNGGLMLRVDPNDTESHVTHDGVDRMEMRGRSMDGWLLLEPAAVAAEDDLARWLAVGVTFVRALPPKVS